MSIKDFEVWLSSAEELKYAREAVTDLQEHLDFMTGLKGVSQKRVAEIAEELTMQRRLVKALEMYAAEIDAADRMDWAAQKAEQARLTALVRTYVLNPPKKPSKKVLRKAHDQALAAKVSWLVAAGLHDRYEAWMS